MGNNPENRISRRGFLKKAASNGLTAFTAGLGGGMIVAGSEKDWLTRNDARKQASTIIGDELRKFCNEAYSSLPQNSKDECLREADKQAKQVEPSVENRIWLDNQGNYGEILGVSGRFVLGVGLLGKFIHEYMDRVDKNRKGAIEKY